MEPGHVGRRRRRTRAADSLEQPGLEPSAVSGGGQRPCPMVRPKVPLDAR